MLTVEAIPQAVIRYVAKSRTESIRSSFVDGKLSKKTEDLTNDRGFCSVSLSGRVGRA